MNQSSSLFLCLLFPYLLSAQNCDDPNSTFEFVGNQNTYFCEGITGVVTVDITVDQNNDPACIDYMKLEWGDGAVETLASNFFGNKTHVYNFPDSIACSLTLDDLNPEVKLTLYFKNNKLNKRTQSLAITPLPRAKFSITGSLCVGKTIDFTNTGCWGDSFVWTYGNGMSSTGEDGQTVYNAPGNYTVSLTATNECGSDVMTALITIRDRPTITAISATPSSGCVPFQSKLTPTATGISLNGYEWKVITSPNNCSSCAQFIPATGKDSVMPIIRFTEPGPYIIRLIGSNECGSDTATIEVMANANPGVMVGTIPPGCNSLGANFNNSLLTYQGTISQYKWTFPPGSSITMFDGMFPGNVTFTQSDTVILKIIGPCATITKQIPITVNSQSPIVFDTLPPAVCATGEPFNLSASPPGGQFSGTGIINATTGLFDPALAGPGTHSIHYQQGVVGCASEGDLSITVLSSDVVTIGGNTSVCRDAVPFPLVANLMPGIWEGPGVVGSIFHPVLAQIGPNPVVYTYTNNNGCVTQVFKEITVVARPAVQVPDTIFTCHIATSIDLIALGNISFTPGLPLAGSALTWVGMGVDAAGKFTSPGAGNYDLSVTYTVPPGCDTTLHFIVRVADLALANAGPDTTVCKSQGTYHLGGSPVAGNWKDSYGAVVSNPLNLSTYAPNTYTFIYTVQPSTPCESSDTVVLTLVGGNSVNAGANRHICNTETTLDLPTMPGLSWSGPSLVGNTINIAALVPNTYAYTLTAANLPAACNKDEFTLTVTAPPSGDFILSQDTSCVGKTVTVLPVSATGEYSVNWDDNTTDNLLTHQYAAAGNYQIVLTVSTSNPLTMATLCSATMTHPIHIIEPIVAGNIKFSMSADSGCSVLTVAFTDSSQAENGQYFWDFGNGTFMGQSPPPRDFQADTATTIYKVSLTVTNGCDSVTFSQLITVFPLPKAKMGLSYLQPCSGGLLKASVLSVGNPETDTFYTNTGLVRAGSLTAPTYFQFFTDPVPLVVGIYLVSSNSCGTDTAYEEVVVHPTDVVAVIGLPDTTRICVGKPITLINDATTGTPITWTVSNLNTYLGDTIQVTFDTAGFYTLTLKVFGCGFDSMTVPVYVHPLPTLSVEHPLSQCPHLPLAFQVMSDAADILLRYGDGDSTLQKISQHYYPGPGPFLPSARATSLYGCVANWSGQLTILTPPQALAVAEDSVCVGDPVIFSGSADQPGITCAWTFGDNSFSDQCTTSHPYLSPGLFNAVFTAISPAGCRGHDTIPVYARSRPSADFIYTIKEKCTPAKVAFVSNALGATGLTWTLGDSTQSTLPQFEHIYQQGQTWLVTLLATNEGICSATTQQMVTVYQTPLIDFILDEQCTLDLGFNLTIETPPGNHVQVTAPGYDRTGDFHPGLLENDYHVYIKTPEGCANDTTIVILPVDELYLHVSQDSFAILLGDSVQLEAEVNMVNVTFGWFPTVRLDNSTIFNPEAKPWEPISYTVTATDDRGCIKTAVVYIEVVVDRDSSLFVPNAFSPNGDGENEVFYVRNQSNPSIDKILEFRIFDKWGEKVFDVRDLPEGDQAAPENIYFGWDGTFRGGKAEAGTYHFQIVIGYVDGFTKIFDEPLILLR